MAINPLDQLVGYTARAENATIRKAALQQGISQFHVFAMKEILRSTAVQATSETADVVAVFARTLGNSIIRLRERRIKALLRPVGEKANQAVVNTYNQRRHGPSGYRQGQRDSGGKLIRALASPNMYRVAQDGIAYINPVWLDSQARQWYRMNFGAGRRGRTETTKPAQYRMRFLGQDTGLTFGLEGRPSPSFSIPGGVWGKMAGNTMTSIVPWDPSRRGQDAFSPSSGFQRRNLTGPGRREANSFLASPSVIHRSAQISRGIRGSRFLDAGIRSLTQGVPVAYTQLFDEWLKEAEGGSGPLITVAADQATIAAARNAINQQLDRYSRAPNVRGLLSRA